MNPIKNIFLITLAVSWCISQVSAQNTPLKTTPIKRTNVSGHAHLHDFLAFTHTFGTTADHPNFDTRTDFDKNGTIDLSDFLLFAQGFQPKVDTQIGPLSSLHTQNIKPTLQVTPQAGQTTNQVTVSIQLKHFQTLRAYQLSLNYDASVLQLMRAETAHPSYLATTQTAPNAVALQTLSDKGDLILSDIFETPIQNDGTLLHLTFQISTPKAISGIAIHQVLIADAQNRITTLQGAHLDDLNPLPATFALNQNHPNPFNPTTQISYQLPQTSDVSLIIYNLLGQQVQQLVNTSQAPGFYHITWNGQDATGRLVASGIYFYRLKTQHYTQTKMMILLK